MAGHRVAEVPVHLVDASAAAGHSHRRAAKVRARLEDRVRVRSAGGQLGHLGELGVGDRGRNVLRKDHLSPPGSPRPHPLVIEQAMALLMDALVAAAVSEGPVVARHVGRLAGRCGRRGSGA